MAKVLEKLVEKLGEDSIVAEIEKSEETTVTISFDSLGEQEEGVVVMSISKVPMEEIEDYSFYNIFSVVAVNIETEGMNQVLANVNELNMECLFGNYGVVVSDGILYHKQVVKIAKADESQMADALYDGMVDVLALLDENYEASIKASMVSE